MDVLREFEKQERTSRLTQLTCEQVKVVGMEFPEEDFSDPEQGGSAGTASRQTDKQSKSSKSNRLQKRASGTDKASPSLLGSLKDHSWLQNKLLVLAMMNKIASERSSQRCSMSIYEVAEGLSHHCRGAPAVEQLQRLFGGGAERLRKSCYAMPAPCESGDPLDDQTGRGRLFGCQLVAR